MAIADTIAALKIGKARIAQGWCKGNWAQDKDGHPVEATSSRAERFCAVGALVDAPLTADGYLDRVAHMLDWNAVAELNDSYDTELRHVLGLYDWAIALAERDEEVRARLRKAGM